MYLKLAAKNAKLCCWNLLNHNVGQHVESKDVLENHLTIFNLFAYKMVPNVDVFGPFVFFSGSFGVQLSLGCLNKS